MNPLRRSLGFAINIILCLCEGMPTFGRETAAALDLKRGTLHNIRRGKNRGHGWEGGSRTMKGVGEKERELNKVLFH